MSLASSRMLNHSCPAVPLAEYVQYNVATRSRSRKRFKVHHHKVRSGCVTCKARRIRCDETKPVCIRCTRSKKTCGGYNLPHAWLFESQSEAHNPDSRQTVERSLSWQPPPNPHPLDNATSPTASSSWSSLSGLSVFSPNYISHLKRTYLARRAAYILNLSEFSKSYSVPSPWTSKLNP